jgi:rubrerythrin
MKIKRNSISKKGDLDMYHCDYMDDYYNYFQGEDPPSHNPRTGPIGPIHTPHGFRGFPSPIHTPHGGFPVPIRIPQRYTPFSLEYPYYPWPYMEYEQQVSNRNISNNKSIVRDLEKAINGEYSAIICYRLLSSQASDGKTKKIIDEIRKDEERHLNQFSHAYFQLTGKKAAPKQTEQCANTYIHGIQLAFEDEQETVDFYNEAADKAKLKNIKHIFRRAALDEQNHAVWFLRFLTKK